MNNTTSANGRNIVIIGIHPWYNFDIGSNCKSIALELSKKNRVLYINMPLDRKTALLHNKDKYISKYLERRKKKELLVKVQENLWNYYPPTLIESINWIPSNRIFSFFNWFNNKRFARDIKKALAEVGFDDYILFNDNDIFRSYHLKELLHPSLYIYYSRDFLCAMEYWKNHGPQFEPKHIAKADLCVANSIYLYKYLAKYNDNSAYIGQGCNISLFDPERVYKKPEDIKNIKGPVIGYVGAIIKMRLDIAIIKTIALERPHYSIVLVGPEDEFFAKSDLHSLPNVYFLGKKPMEELPAYIASFDVCINPQLLNEITIGNYPLKIDEYLAMGKAAVATKTQAMEIFDGYVYMADNASDYPALIDTALSESDEALRQRRIAVARTHTWENCISTLNEAIETTFIKKNSRAL